MMKKWVLAAGLLSLAMSMGCRNVRGINKINVAVTDAGNLSVLYVGQQVQFTATVTGTSNTAVTWSLSADIACTGNPSPCGTLSSSGLYTAPAVSPGNSVNITITATSQADSTISGSLSVRVHQITVVITPNSPNVGVNLSQQFVAVAVPDDAPQTFTWSNPTCTTPPCGTISVPDPNNTALAVYKAPGSPSPANDVKFVATSTVDTTGFTQATVTVVKSRLVANATYPFRFSGFNSNGATAMAGFLVVANDGVSLSGVEDLQTATGGFNEYAITGTYSAVSNNQGKIDLSGAPGGTPNKFTVVLDANGDIQMIESDVNGTGSGVIEQLTTAPSKFNLASLCGSFVFGVTGVHLSGTRVGYAGVLPMDGNGNIGTACGGGASPGLVDINDGGTASSANDVGGTYTMSGGVGSMNLTSSTFGSFHFNLYVVSGVVPPKANNPTTLYAISTDANPVISGTVVFQDPNGAPYNTGTFKNGNASVVSLTGVGNSGANVSLTIATTDGNGGLSGNFDQNDDGTIVSVSNFSTGYTYAGTGSGRYTFKLLGNPSANPVVPPLPFVLYASGANKGFILDQSSPSVMAGTMYLQTAPKGQAGIFAPSNFPGTWAAATTSSGASNVDPIAANLLLTWVNDETSPACTNQCVDGTQYDASGSQTFTTETYAIQASGFGKFSPISPATTPNYVLYVIDITHVLAMDVDSTNANASIIYAQQ